MDFKSGQQWARFDIDDSDDVDYLKVVDGVIASVEDHSSSSSSGRSSNASDTPFR